MKRKKYIKTADKVYGVKAVIDCTNLKVDKNKLFHYLDDRALRCAWADPNTIVEYEVESEDVECYWKMAGKRYGYTLYKNIKLIDFIPNWEKIYKRRLEIAAESCESSTPKPSRSTVYDRVFSVTTYRAD